MSKVAPSSVKRALAEIKALRARVETAEGALHAPIAVVGLSVRLPGGVSDADALWALLRSGGDAIGEIPADRWSVDELYSADPDAPGKMRRALAASLTRSTNSIRSFFGISPREAATHGPPAATAARARVGSSRERGHRAGLAARLARRRVRRHSATATTAARSSRDPASIDPYFATGTVLQRRRGPDLLHAGSHRARQ